MPTDKKKLTKTVLLDSATCAARIQDGWKCNGDCKWVNVKQCQSKDPLTGL